MKCIISSAQYWDIDSFVDEYAKIILEAGFTLERLDEDEDNDARILIELSSIDDLKKLANAVGHNIIFDPQRSYGDIFPTFIIYDDYME